MDYYKKSLQNTYYFPFKSKCLSNANGTILTSDYNLHYFLIASNNPCFENEIHLIEFNDKNNYVKNRNIYKINGEIKNMICIDSFEENDKKKILLCTSGKMLNKDIQSIINEKNESCFLWIGHLNLLNNENNEIIEKENNKIDNNEIKQIENNEIDNNEIKQIENNEIDNEIKEKENNEIDNEIKEKENNEKVNEIKEKENNEINDIYNISENIEKQNNLNYLENIYELKSIKQYNNIKNITIHEDENKNMKIGIIDQNGYTIYEKNKDIIYKQSNIINKTFNYGVFDPHHENITLISDINIYGYDIKSNKQVFSAFTNHHSTLSSIDFNPNIPNLIITSANDGNIKLWDLRFLKESFFSINIHSYWINNIQFNNFHDELLLSCSSDNTLKLHKITYSNINFHKKNTNYQLIKTYKTHEDSIYNAKWSNTDAWIFASLSYDGKCSINNVPLKEKYNILL